MISKGWQDAEAWAHQVPFLLLLSSSVFTSLTIDNERSLLV